MKHFRYDYTVLSELFGVFSGGYIVGLSGI